MLLTLHKGYFGMTKMKSKARRVLCWLRMSKEIEVFVAKCCVCQKFAVSSPRERLLLHERPSLPFNKIGRVSAEEFNTEFKGVFATPGIPKLVIADNIQFWSRECMLAQKWGFTIVTISPHYPCNKWMADRAVRTVKSMLKKCHEDGSSIELPLLQYLLFPTCGTSHLPSEILMSRNIPVSEHQVRPVVEDNFEEQLKEIARKSKLSYDRVTRAREGFALALYPTVVDDRHTNPRSYWVREFDGKVVWKNSYHLKQWRISRIMNVPLEDEDAEKKDQSRGEEELVRGPTQIGDRESRHKSVTEAE
ncbi:hypothetical protein PR048_003765 [Dryococelus australis]|uniref:RNA-directed DNA polymerase n=1 Tax=Dryococelus australis TaxID=614101 RepID=A0ABQ9IQ74_9NEOP|nr:hypothetical protein PR048_003765 [Dryococelus australis]